MLEALEPSEHDFQEFKGAAFLYDGARIITGFTAALSRQVSAFANGAGGKLYIGLNDEGEIDGGVPVDLKGGGTRSWLEDVIPGCVDPPLRRFNVFEVPHPERQARTRIKPGHAVYVIEIEASEDAPHQAFDYRYYIRIAGKSRPMGNVHIKDVLQRTRHPRVDLVRVGPYGSPERVSSDPRGPKVLLCFQTFINNLGRTLAHHVGVELLVPRPLVNGEVRQRTHAEGEVHLTQRPGELTFFTHQPHPLFPDQEIAGPRLWLTLHNNNAELVRSGDLELRWRVFADDAPPRHGSTPLRRFAVVKRSRKTLTAEQRRNEAST